MVFPSSLFLLLVLFGFACSQFQGLNGTYEEVPRGAPELLFPLTYAGEQIKKRGASSPPDHAIISIKKQELFYHTGRKNPEIMMIKKDGVIMPFVMGTNFALHVGKVKKKVKTDLRSLMKKRVESEGVLGESNDTPEEQTQQETDKKEETSGKFEEAEDDGTEQHSYKIVVYKDIDEVLALTQYTHHIKNKKNRGKDEKKKCGITAFQYNIWHDRSLWERRRAKLIDMINTWKPDIIGFQEVRYKFSQLNPHEDTKVAALKRFQHLQLIHFLIDYQFVFQPVMTYMKGHEPGGFHEDEGLAIFSRYHIKETSFLRLTRNLTDPDDEHNRGVLRALVDVPCIGDVNVFVTHFSLSKSARRKNIVELWDFVSSFPTPQILMGDFNEEPDTEVMRFLTGKTSLDGKQGDFVDVWENLHPKLSGHTFTSWEPVKRIDYLLFRGYQLKAQDIELVGSKPEILPNGKGKNYPSDHLGLISHLVKNEQTFPNLKDEI